MILLYYLLLAYWVIMFVRVLSSWFPAPISGPLRTLLSFCYRVTDPVLTPIRRAVPPMRAGMMALDLSPIIVFVVIGVLLQVVRSKV
jgi:YggT family protein